MNGTQLRQIMYHCSIDDHSNEIEVGRTYVSCAVDKPQPIRTERISGMMVEIRARKKRPGADTTFGTHRLTAVIL